MFTCFAGQDGINFFKGAMGFKLFEKVFVIDPDMGYIESLAPLGKDFPEGFLGSQHYPFYILDNPASNAFVKKYREATGTLPNLAVQSYVTVYALANAIKKAGVVDVEKVVDALSGMKLKDTPVGDMIIQDFDHQATWPYWLGKVKYSEKHGLAILTNPESFPAEKIYQSRDEVKALRAKGGR
jgi:ABC-type branched-subunit amino acid transport system substrate-binding protein